MTQAEDWHLIKSKRKAIIALLPYAVRKEREGQPEMFNAFLRVVRASKDRDFTWRHIKYYAARIPPQTSPRAIILVLPRVRWGLLTNREDLIQRWAVAAFAVPCTEEIAQNMVDTLLQIASQSELISHIPVDTWSWLIKRPSLPPACHGRDIGTRVHVVKAVRALGDIEVLKSYFLLVWSQWNYFSPNRYDGVYPSYRNIRDSGLSPRPRSSHDSRSATTHPTFQKDAETHIPDSMLRPHSSNGPGSIATHDPHSITGRTPSRDQPFTAPTMTPSPSLPHTSDYTSSHHLPNTPDDTLSTHPTYRIPSPDPPYTIAGSHAPYIPGQALSRHSKGSDHTSSFHPPCSSDDTSGTLYPRYNSRSRYPRRRTLNSHAPPSTPDLPMNPYLDCAPYHCRIYISDGFDEIETSIQEDFGGIGMEHHRADLVQRLDHILKRLGRGVGYLKRHNPALDERHLWRMEYLYEKLREGLLDVDAKAEAIRRASHPTIPTICMLTSTPGYAQDPTQRLCARFPSHALSLAGTLGTPTPYIVRTSASISPI